MLDLLIKGGTVVDGSGQAGFTADVGIANGRIVEVGRLSTTAVETIDANGALVTPGFVDIHTHFDGQASWDETFSPIAEHGVTTVVMGNCGVGFAPLRPGDQARLVSLMEGVEEIPGAALSEGIRWGWESFADFMHALDGIPHSLDFMTLVPHDCVRLYVMGDRAARGEPATTADLAEMQQLLHAALAAGAVGFSTGRSDNHRTSKGEETPAAEASGEELVALAQAFAGLPYRVLHAVSDFNCMRGEPADQRARFDTEYAMLESVARAAGRPLGLTCLERINSPEQWRWLVEKAAASSLRGIDIRLQVASRGIGLLNGLETSFNVLMAFPSYQELSTLPLAERVVRLRDPSVRARILAETPVKLARDGSSVPPLADQILSRIDQAAMLMYPFDTKRTPDYEPDPMTSFGVQALQKSTGALGLIYDWLATGDGENLVYFPIFNYLGGSLETTHAMLTSPHALAALGDAGAHVGTVCDASMTTMLLGYWTRTRERGPRLPLPLAVEMLSGRNARHLGLTDRGLVKAGLRADLNIVDYDNLRIEPPRMVHDLPAGGRRFVQGAHGYIATLVAGQRICENGRMTAARPGRLVRAS